MSVQAMSWVFDHSRHKGSELLCLLAIANYAHADGSGAYPSMKRLAADCRMSERQIVRLIKRLEESGALLVERGKSPRGTNLMTIVMDPALARDSAADNLAPDNLSDDVPAEGDNLSEVSPATAEDDKSGQPGVPNRRAGDDTTVSPKPSARTVSKNRQKPLAAAASALDPPANLDELEIARLLRQVRGLGPLGTDELVAHLREIQAARVQLASGAALRLDALKFRDHWNVKRKSQPEHVVWRGWRNAMTNWFAKTREPASERTRDAASGGLLYADRFNGIQHREYVRERESHD